MINDPTFGFHGVITLWCGIFLSCFIAYHVYDAFKQAKRITLLELFGIFGSFGISFLPVVGAFLTLVVLIVHIGKGILYLVKIMDEIVIFDKNK